MTAFWVYLLEGRIIGIVEAEREYRKQTDKDGNTVTEEE